MLCSFSLFHAHGNAGQKVSKMFSTDCDWRFLKVGDLIIRDLQEESRKCETLLVLEVTAKAAKIIFINGNRNGQTVEINFFSCVGVMREGTYYEWSKLSNP